MGTDQCHNAALPCLACYGVKNCPPHPWGLQEEHEERRPCRHTSADADTTCVHARRDTYAHNPQSSRPWGNCEIASTQCTPQNVFWATHPISEKMRHSDQNLRLHKSMCMAFEIEAKSTQQNMDFFNRECGIEVLRPFHQHAPTSSHARQSVTSHTSLSKYACETSFLWSRQHTKIPASPSTFVSRCHPTRQSVALCPL